MAKSTSIEWCDSTFNPFIGCQKVGPGCDHCYAETHNARFSGGAAINWGPGAPRRRTSAANWQKPLRWDKNHEAFFAQHGRRQRVFCASLADVFDNEVPVQWRRDLFDLIARTPSLDWLLLTKRIGNVRSLYGEAYLDSARALPPNVWIGATICNQEEADRDIPKLLDVPAAKRFLSMEPLLGPVDLTYLPMPGGDRMIGLPSNAHMNSINGFYDMNAGAQTKIDWVIVGGESGPGARPMHPAWVRSLRDQCVAAGVPFFFKQWGEFVDIHGGRGEGLGFVHKHEPDIAMLPDGRLQNPRFNHSGAKNLYKVGKKVAGRLLDGREWNEVPK